MYKKNIWWYDMKIDMIYWCQKASKDLQTNEQLVNYQRISFLVCGVIWRELTTSRNFN